MIFANHVNNINHIWNYSPQGDFVNLWGNVGTYTQREGVSVGSVNKFYLVASLLSNCFTKARINRGESWLDTDCLQLCDQSWQDATNKGYHHV